MSDLITPARVAAIATGSRIDVADGTPQRVADAANPTFARFAAAEIVVPFELEPASFLIAQRRGAGR